MEMVLCVWAVAACMLGMWTLWLRFRISREKLRMQEYEQQRRWLVEDEQRRFEESTERVEERSLQLRKDVALAEKARADAIVQAVAVADSYQKLASRQTQVMPGGIMGSVNYGLFAPQYQRFG